jgi:hypothetical protein
LALNTDNSKGRFQEENEDTREKELYQKWTNKVKEKTRK